MSILLVGGTGHVGREVGLTLSRHGFPVIAMLRGGRNHPGSQQLIDGGINVVEGDLRSPGSLGAAVQGIESVFCSATSMPAAADDGLRQVDHDGTLALIEAAERHGVKKFIYVSYSGNIRLDSPLERAKRDCESHLMRGGMETVILRPSYFMEMWLGPMPGFDPAKGSVRIYGSGNAKVSYISSSNVADFAVACATAPTGEKKTILELGGPESLSQLEVVRIFERILGREMRIESVPIEALRVQHESPDPLSQTFGALMLGYANGDEIPNAVETARRYGVRLRSVSDYASSFAAPPSVA